MIINNSIILNNQQMQDESCKIAYDCFNMADGSMLSLIGKSNWKEIKLGLVIRDDGINIKYPNSENKIHGVSFYITFEQC